MHRLLHALPFILTCLIASAQETHPVAWPPGVEAKIDEAVFLQKETMKKKSNLRLPDDSAKEGFGRCMDAIAIAVAGKGLEFSLQKAEGTDLKAKIALWALDRKQRPEVYQRILETYTGHNPSGAGRVPNSSGLPLPSASQPLRPRITSPPSVKPEDRTADMRLVLEYSYFAPPAPIGFGNDYWRSNLADALRRIGDDKSLGLLVADLRTQVELRPDEPGTRANIGVGEGLEAVCSYRNEQAFRGLAELWSSPAMRGLIQKRMLWIRHPSSPGTFYGDAQEPKKDADAWEALAQKEWQTDNEKALAAFLKTLPPVSAQPGR